MEAFGRRDLGEGRAVGGGRDGGQERLPAGQRPRQQTQEPGGAHEALEPAHLVEAQPRGGQREQARVRKQHVEIHPAKESAEGAAGALSLDVGTRGFDQLAIGNRGGTHRLAGAAAEAEIEVRGGGVGEADAPLRHGLDEEDPAARRIHLGAENGKGRAIGEAEAAVHAAVDALDVVPMQQERPRDGHRPRVMRHALRSLPRSGPG